MFRDGDWCEECERSRRSALLWQILDLIPLMFHSKQLDRLTFRNETCSSCECLMLRHLISSHIFSLSHQKKLSLHCTFTTNKIKDCPSCVCLCMQQNLHCNTKKVHYFRKLWQCLSFLFHRTVAAAPRNLIHCVFSLYQQIDWTTASWDQGQQFSGKDHSLIESSTLHTRTV